MLGRVALVVLGAAVAVASASPAQAASNPRTTGCSFRLVVRALADTAGTDVALAVVPRGPRCRALPRFLRAVELRAAGRVRRLGRVAVPAGHARVSFAALRRHARLTVRAEARGTSVRGATRVRLRPDLVVRLSAPPAVLAGKPFSVAAVVAERNRDSGATARLTISAGGQLLGAASVRVRAGGSIHLGVPVTLGVSSTLVGRVEGASPREFDPESDEATVAVEVTTFQLDRSQVLVPSFGGYGAQFNHHVYAAISRGVGVTDENVVQMENEVLALKPQLVRVFFNKSAFTDPDRMQSFVRTVQLAQRAGATIDVTWQSSYGPLPLEDMTQFAGVLADLVRNRAITNLRWVSVQNEVNATRISADQYEQKVRQLDADLRRAGVRQQIRFMGGDLVAATSPLGQSQRDWFQLMATRLGDVVDAYSIHVFWDYWDTPKLVRRLSEVRAIVDSLPDEARKPLYVTEYGVRGRPSSSAPGGVWDDGTPFQSSNVNASQLAWFDILAARLGYAGTIKWDAYFGKYDNGTQDYNLIGGPQDGWPERPAYHVLHLFTASTEPGWRVLGVDQSTDTRLVTAYAGSGGSLTVVGLDTAGASLSGISPQSSTYVVGGLPANTTFRLLEWNAAGDGLLADLGSVTADAAGVVTVTIPLNAVFALTTLEPALA